MFSHQIQYAAMITMVPIHMFCGNKYEQEMSQTRDECPQRN